MKAIAKTYAAILVGALLMVLVMGDPAEAGIRKRYSSGYANQTQLEIKLGLHDRDGIVQTVEWPGYRIDHSFDDLSFSIGATHWVDDNVAVTAALTVLDADTEDDVDYYSTYSRESGVVSIQMGARYYFPISANYTPVRPYLAFTAGPVVGTTTERYIDTRIFEETRTEVAFGGYVGGGVDFRMGRHFMIGLSGGYMAMSDFDQPINYDENYSGPEFGLSFGFVF